MLNPKDPEQDGFYLTSDTTETASLPIEISQFGGTTYYGEAEPFPTFHRINSVYP